MALNAFEQALRMLAERLRKCIQPVGAGDEILKQFSRLNVLNAEGDSINAFVHRTFEYSVDLR